MVKLFKDLIVSSIYLYLFQALNYLLPFFILPYLLSTLSLSSFGIFAFSQSLIQFLALIVDYGFNLSASKKIAALPKDSSEVAIIYWQVLFVKSCLFTSVALVTWFLFATVGTLAIYENAVYLSLFTLLGTVLFPVWLYQGLNRMKSMTIILAVAKLSTLPFVFLFVQSSEDYLPAVFIHSASFLVAGVFSFIWILTQKKYREACTRYGNIQDNIFLHFKDSFPYFLSSASTTLYTSSLTMLLGFFGSTSQVGIFAAVEKIVRIICFGVYIPINQAVFPVIARLRHADFSQAQNLFRVIFYIIGALMTVIVITYFLFGSELINRFLNNSVDMSIMRILIFSIIPVALGAVCGQLGLIALGDDKHKKIFTKIYIYIGLIALPLCIVSIFFFKTEGAVFSMMITEFAVFTSMFTAAKKSKYL